MNQCNKFMTFLIFFSYDVSPLCTDSVQNSFYIDSSAASFMGLKFSKGNFIGIILEDSSLSNYIILSWQKHARNSINNSSTFNIIRKADKKQKHQSDDGNNGSIDVCSALSIHVGDTMLLGKFTHDEKRHQLFFHPLPFLSDLHFTYGTFIVPLHAWGKQMGRPELARWLQSWTRGWAQGRETTRRGALILEKNKGRWDGCRSSCPLRAHCLITS